MALEWMALSKRCCGKRAAHSSQFESLGIHTNLGRCQELRNYLCQFWHRNYFLELSWFETTPNVRPTGHSPFVARCFVHWLAGHAHQFPARTCAVWLLELLGMHVGTKHSCTPRSAQGSRFWSQLFVEAVLLTLQMSSCYVRWTSEFGDDANLHGAFAFGDEHRWGAWSSGRSSWGGFSETTGMRTADAYWTLFFFCILVIFTNPFSKNVNLDINRRPPSQ